MSEWFKWSSAKAFMLVRFQLRPQIKKYKYLVRIKNLSYLCKRNENTKNEYYEQKKQKTKHRVD